MAKNIRRETERIIDHDAAIKKDLARNLINVRALARFIQKKLGIAEPVSLDAIISAIRRYPMEERLKKFERTFESFKKCRFTIKNKIVDISLVNDIEVQRSISDIVALINFDRGEIMRVVSGVESMKIIVDEKNLGKVLQHFKKSKVIGIAKGLSEIVISFSREAEQTPGIVSKITTELALNDINLIEIMSCAPELILIVDEKDTLKAYELLQELAS